MVLRVPYELRRGSTRLRRFTNADSAPLGDCLVEAENTQFMTFQTR